MLQEAALISFYNDQGVYTGDAKNFTDEYCLVCVYSTASTQETEYVSVTFMSSSVVDWA